MVPRSVIPLVLTLLLAFAAAADWPMFRLDTARTGAMGPGPGAELAIAWNFTTGFPVYSSPAVVDGTVYVGSWDGKMYTLDARTGEEVWRFDTGTAISSSPAVHHGVVFFGAGDGLVYALDGRTGNEKWKYETGASIS
ncbi:MAG: PQQ-binding-like beta-propeller repeat protein, partial [Methanopyri archaeon]|nr:PQQ-binding-like beta-propeller repeat protein [Methanopyri archaeon]